VVVSPSITTSRKFRLIPIELLFVSQKKLVAMSTSVSTQRLRITACTTYCYTIGITFCMPLCSSVWLSVCVCVFVVLGLEPAFDSASANVTVTAGQTALLPCSIAYLGRYKVRCALFKYSAHVVIILSYNSTKTGKNGA